MTAGSEPHDGTVVFAVEVAGPVLRVAFKGELDLACAQLFDTLFDLETDGIETVELDLAALSFCDVTGGNALTGLRSFHRCSGRAADFTGTQPQVRRLMALLDARTRPLSGEALSG